jgi:hypothetical protein
MEDYPVPKNTESKYFRKTSDADPDPGGQNDPQKYNKF